MSNLDVSNQIMDRLRESGLYDDIFGRAPRYRYFQKGNGSMFCWTVEPVDDDGKYESYTYKPIGKGARSGEAQEWKLVAGSIRRHRKRKDAKARALRLFEQAA